MTTLSRGQGRRETALCLAGLFLVLFLLSGLWHGAGWGFLIWGALHGLVQVAQRLLKGKLSLPKPLAWALTFLFVSAAWVFFRADSVKQALTMLSRLFAGGWGLPSEDFAAALPLEAMSVAFSFIQYSLLPGGMGLVYWLPLLFIPAGMALLACPNPLAQAERFRPTVGKAVLTTLCLVGSVLFFSGVATFIYANF